MRTHNGMRPQDIAILLKIIILKGADWQYRDLSASLFISASEISESLNRSHIAGLIDESRRKVFRQSLMEFIEHGIHYVFPQLPGSMVTGTATAHSYSFYKEKFIGELDYVWPDDNGDIRGLAIEPLYKGAVKAAKTDPSFHKLLASIDILRVGQAREKKAALLELHKTIDK